MRKMCCWLLAAVLLLLVGCGSEKAPQSYTYQETEAGSVTETDHLQVTIEAGCLKETDDKDWAVYQLEQAYEKAASFLGVDGSAEEPIRCTICAGDGLTRIQEAALEIYFYETVEQPYTNYMIQTLAGINAPDWLREGLAAYGADQAGESLLNSYAATLTELDSYRTEEDKESPVEKDITTLAKALYVAGNQEEALLLGDMLLTMSQMEDPEMAGQYHGAYCIFAGSFVKYLVEEKGLEAVLKVYQGEDFNTVMGQPLATAQKAWIANTFKN